MIPLVYKGILLKNAMGFNRTFMELKLCTPLTASRWLYRFNRTFMELKQGRAVVGCLDDRRFNRTFMELKLLIHLEAIAQFLF